MKAHQCINFTPSNFKMIQDGKRTTIRLGTKSLTLGPVALTCDEGMDALSAYISEIRVVSFGLISQDDAANDGFNSVSDLKDELQRCYSTEINDHDVVTVIKFKIC
ncbi:ASCH domain-containing protein [Aeromonas diversa]|uniref:ASCH domain-containing protein n=1 Tax=Aeromonas diversa TaxID=502790 RepID=UPI0039A1B754